MRLNVRAGVLIFYHTRRFILLSEIGFASPSSSTATRPGLMVVPSVGVTTMPARLLYLALAEEVNKIVVIVVPDDGI